MKHGEKFFYRSFPYGLTGKNNYEILTFRKDPIPGSGKTGSGGRFKSPKTTQERRCNGKSKWVRAKRRMQNLPEAWDDYQRGDVDHRSWKTQGKKRKQWM